MDGDPIHWVLHPVCQNRRELSQLQHKLDYQFEKKKPNNIKITPKKANTESPTNHSYNTRGLCMILLKPLSKAEKKLRKDEYDVTEFTPQK